VNAHMELCGSNTPAFSYDFLIEDPLSNAREHAAPRGRGRARIVGAIVTM